MLRLTAQRTLRNLTPATRALPTFARAAPTLISRAAGPSAARALSVSAPRAVPSKLGPTQISGTCTRVLTAVCFVTAAALSAKIGEELQFESEHADESEPEFLQEFKKEGVWQVS